MAIRSTPLGSVTVSGDEAKALTRQLVYGRSTRAAMAAAKNGRQLVRSFDVRGSVLIHLSRTDQECVARALESQPTPAAALKRACDRRNKLLPAE
ncbi:hypothetical protein [Hydrogenophaga sp. SL48]|uniref:hypothetical protein n=1 Tax=Hydrogenophaga sp. SL48 TaxID=2806347 RepID=UPI001F478928|nr:hypothetical protein [Hydrogenophaga sp. SL48]UJW82282.1 hypothetical protein IM738_06190 [Hydrogenophaga sp. SL48]